MAQTVPSNCGIAELQFEAILDKLFDSSKVNVRYLQHSNRTLPATQQVEEEHINNADDFGRSLSHYNNSQIKHGVFVIVQDYSWGRLQITEACFRLLYASLGSSSRLLGIATAFGVKTGEDERRVYDARACSTSAPCSRNLHEICYCINYMSKNNRGLKDPWSARQLGVYHQTQGQGDASRWVIFDLAKHATEDLQQSLKERLCHSQAALHLNLLVSVSSTWAEYVEYLAAEVTKYDHKACYTSLVGLGDSPYDVAYVDLQSLHTLNNKIGRAETAVESCLSVAQSCELYFTTHSCSSPSENTEDHDTSMFQTYTTEMSRCRESLIKLKSRLRDILDLIGRVLVCRNGELLQTSNSASYKTLNVLVDITNQSKQQQETLATILGNGRADSAMLKALSVVATVCLPAALVAAIFQSNLIGTVGPTPEDPVQHLVVSPQFWIYIVITIPLMCLTLTWTLYLNKRSQKSYHGP